MRRAGGLALSSLGSGAGETRPAALGTARCPGLWFGAQARVRPGPRLQERFALSISFGRGIFCAVDVANQGRAAGSLAAASASLAKEASAGRRGRGAAAAEDDVVGERARATGRPASPAPTRSRPGRGG